MTKIKLYYSISDHFPAYRLDLSELFGISLKEKGLDTTWFMANNGPNLLPRRDFFFNKHASFLLSFPARASYLK